MTGTVTDAPPLGRALGWLIGLAVLVPATAFVVATRDQPGALALVVPLLLVALHLAGLERRALRDAGAIVAGLGGAAVVVVYGGKLVTTALAGIAAPPGFDFQVFWSYARVAAEGFDFYQFERVHELARTTFDASPDLLVELFFWYPPLTMLLTLPLGLFEPTPAAMGWYAAHGLALLASAALLARLFMGPRWVLGFVVALAALVALYVSYLTALAAQTNFLALLLTLLAFADRARARAGVWIVLGAVVKPMVAFMGLPFLLRRRWRVVGAAIATGLALVLLTVLLFGPGIWVTYLADNPTAEHAPDFLYTQSVNQSLLAAILRWTGGTPDGIPVLDPVFLTLAATILIVSCLIMVLDEVVSDEHALALAVPLGLIVYPGSLHHYFMLLLVPLGYVWTRRGRRPMGVAASTMVAGLTVLLLEWGWAENALVAALFIWLVLAGLGLVAIVKAAREPASAEPVRMVKDAGWTPEAGPLEPTGAGTTGLDAT